MSIFQDIAKHLTSNDDPNGDLPELSDINSQSPEERKLVEHVKSKIDSIRQTSSRIVLEGVYLTNVAYLLGFDGVMFDTTYRQFRNVDAKRKMSRNRFKVNKILPTVQNRLSRLTQSPPRYDVRPKSNSTEDKDAARLSLQILEHVFENQRFTEKRQDLLMAAMQGGHAYIQVIWDPNLGKPMIDPDTGEFDEYEGDIRLDILNCLEVFPDPLAKSVDDCAYWVKAKVRKLDYFRERYPDRGEAVKEEDAWLLSSIYDLKSNALTSVGIAGAQTQNQMQNSAIELVYYEKRSREHPNGRMIVVANGVLLEDKELPIGEFDLIKFDDIMVGSRYNSEAVITHLRPVQDQYNLTRTKMADWVRKLLAGKYLAAKGAGLGQEALNNDNGEVVEYNPVPNAAPPSPMIIPQIPSYAYKDIETLDQEFDFISGINEISRGVLPSASIPASGMAFLQEQDQTRIGVQTSRNEVGYAKVGQAILKYAAKNYELPRTLKIAGDGLDYAVKDFIGSDIKDNFDAIVIEGSTIPSSKVLRRQDILNDFQLGLMGDPQDPKVRQRVNKMLEYGDTAEIWKKQALDEAQVKKIIESISKGDTQAVQESLNEFDNHSFHLEEMNDFRKGDKFDAFDPNQKKLFMFVMEWRLQALSGIQNPQQAQQTQMAQVMVNQMHANGMGHGGPQGPMAKGMHGMPQAQSMTNQQPNVDATGNIQAPPPQQAPVPNATAPIR